METHIFQNVFDQIQPRIDKAVVESPLEEYFIETLEKFISHKAEIFPQLTIETICGTFRLDFLIKIGNKRIAFECDGKDFHNAWRDEWRDALILGSGRVDTIYRFRGKDIHCFVNECLHVVYHYDKEIFTDRYTEVSQTLIPSNVSFFYRSELNNIEIKVYDEEGKQVFALSGEVRRRSKDQENAFWKKLYEKAQRNPKLSFEGLLELHKKPFSEYNNN